MTFWPLTNSDFPTDQTFQKFHDLYTELDLHRIMSGFHGTFATGVASQQGTLTPPDTWFRPPFLGACICSDCWDKFPDSTTDLMTVPNLTFTELRGFHGAFATGVASQQGALTLPDTWFRPPFWDLLMLQLLRPNSSNLPCLYSTFHLEYPLVLSRFCFSNSGLSIVKISSRCREVSLNLSMRLKRFDFWRSDIKSLS